MGTYKGNLYITIVGNNQTNVYDYKTHIGFNLEITKWKEQNNNIIIMSAKFSGTVKGTVGAFTDITFTDREIIELPVEVAEE